MADARSPHNPWNRTLIANGLYYLERNFQGDILGGIALETDYERLVWWTMVNLTNGGRVELPPDVAKRFRAAGASATDIESLAVAVGVDAYSMYLHRVIRSPVNQTAAQLCDKPAADESPDQPSELDV